MSESIAEKKVSPNKPTPVLGVCIVLAVLCFLVVTATAPLPGEPGFWMRLLIGALSLWFGAILYVASLHVTIFCLKAIIEIFASILIFFNLLYGVIVYSSHPELLQSVNEVFEPSKNIYSVAILVFVSAVVLLVINVTVLFILYPLAQTAGTNLMFDEE